MLPAGRLGPLWLAAPLGFELGMQSWHSLRDGGLTFDKRWSGVQAYCSLNFGAWLGPIRTVLKHYCVNRAIEFARCTPQLQTWKLEYEVETRQILCLESHKTTDLQASSGESP
ncbi:hypothetical protein N656DRAFT_353002 [Canariomyces notabilis]|uniref:Uncharacterized protein n=1 Tax=Canariomyces notabilis TaxID=2074819 RepID=A0AAN6QF21_9PEZI|nr:hypothetical protein N656DRAFT_353002 [Canariomyces arenarius]